MQPKKLTIMPIVNEAYSGAWSHTGEMIRLIWLPGLLYIIVSLFSSFYQTRDQIWLAVLLNLAGLFLWPIIAVAWHRFILLGDMTSKAASFHFGRREARFLMVTIFLFLMLVPSLMFMTMANQLMVSSPEQQGTISAFALAGLVLLGLAIAYLPRLALLLPAIAVDDALDPRQLLEATRGNFWRLVAILALTSLPVVIAYMLLSEVVAAIGLPLVLVLAFAPVVTIYLAVLNVAALSIAYRDLMGPAGTRPPQQQSENPLG